MILADKITQLRKQAGWSQEQLAEKLEVSRQSVSKWESTQSIPDLNKIIKLANLFGVTTDYLIMDERSEVEYTNTEIEEKLPSIGLEQCNDYIESKVHKAVVTAKGVAWCVTSPGPLFFLLALSTSRHFALSSNTAAALGIISVLVMVAVGISYFVRTNQYEGDLAQFENLRFELSFGVHGVLEDRLQKYYPIYNTRLSVGIALFLFSSVPLLAVAIFSGQQEWVLLMLIVLLALLSLGLIIVIPTAAKQEAFKFLLCEGDTNSGKSNDTRNAEKLGAFYWPLLVAIYLGWSLWTMQWGVTWILFPVGAVAFAALVGLMGLFKKDD